jgi:DNA helicase-2/ATP-dependent DNA helicase PcrA
VQARVDQFLSMTLIARVSGALGYNRSLMTHQTDDGLLQGLNPDQRQAVEHIDGPLLIVAGPGSGKTRVITHRIAYLVKHAGIEPGRIAAVTFTNRAAREMRSRLDSLLGDRARYLTASTFHSLCAQILRRDGEAIGLSKDFVIMDDGDQLGLVKRAMEIAEVDPKRFPPRSVINAISAAKSHLVSPEGMAQQANGYYEEVVRRIFIEYQGLMSRSHGVDFDDLLTKTIELFRSSIEVRAKWQERYIHLMVDEFQDTNVAQYEIAKVLAGKYKNLGVVGDPDQSIYSWRNADIRNILSFKKDFPGTVVVNLSQNYRSTATILGAARKLIATNRQRLDQDLFTENEHGSPVIIAEAYNEDEEAQLVIQEVERLIKDEGYSLRDCVVTYRVNAQSRAMEESCLRYGIPYKLVGGVRFYQRREVKDLIAYLRMLQDPYDEISFVRVINVPTRGIGKRTVDDLMLWAQSMGVPAYVALQLLAGDGSELAAPATNPFNPRQCQQLVGFLQLLNGLRESMAELELTNLIDEVLERTGYRQSLLESDEPDSEDRLDNLREFRGVSAEFEGLPSIESLQPFLENAALVSDQDALTDDEQQYLTLITLHQIKGLEYPVVFIIGFEDGVLPHQRSIDDPDQLEEERRIAYVGMTRARKRLYLLRAFRRRLFGAPTGNPPSRFLRDLPDNLIETPATRARASGGGLLPKGRADGVVLPAGEKSSIEAAPPPFKAGDKVMHASFGDGIVVNCASKQGDHEITVAFRGQSGIKRLLHSFAKLEKVERENS